MSGSVPAVRAAGNGYRAGRLDGGDALLFQALLFETPLLDALLFKQLMLQEPLSAFLLQELPFGEFLLGTEAGGVFGFGRVWPPRPGPRHGRHPSAGSVREPRPPVRVRPVPVTSQALNLVGEA